MRLQSFSFLLFTAGIVTLAACTGEITGGNAGIGPGSNSGADGRPASAPDAAPPQPALALSLGTEAMPTELLSTAEVSVNLQGSDGFAGAVALSAKVVDATGADVPGYTAVVTAPTVTLTANGQGSTKVTVTVDNKAVVGATLKVSAASSVPTLDAVKPMTIANQVTFKIDNDGNGGCKYPTTGTVEVVVGTKVRFLAIATLGNGLEIHSVGGAQGVPHQAQGGDNTLPLVKDQAYERTTNGVGAFDWYCHQPGPNLNQQGVNNNPKISVVAQ